MGLGGVAIAVLPSVVHLQLTFSDRLGGVLSKYILYLNIPSMRLMASSFFLSTIFA